MLKIHTIDCHYQRPQFAASYLLTDGKKAIFIENNTSHAVPYLLESLKQHHLTPAQVDYIMVTHAHLDHAGGTAQLLAQCPNATVLAHPKAARTLMDPSKLLASAKKVYGEEAFTKLYGQVLPIPAPRVRSLADNEEILWEGAHFKFLHTLGHATHHFCVHEKTTNSIFTGDAFGVRYPQVSKSFIFPSSSPIDFDPVEAKKSIEKIVKTGATTAYLTHYDCVTDLTAAARELTRHLDFHEKVLTNAKALPVKGNELLQYCENELRSYFRKEVSEQNIQIKSDTWDTLELDITINAQGIAFVAERFKNLKPC